MVARDFPPRACVYCGDAPCEWDKYGKDIIGSRLRMQTAGRKMRTPRHIDQALRQLYFYKKHGSLSKKTLIELPLCVAKGVERLNQTIRRVCLAAAPEAASRTASRADRTARDAERSASR
ncbi:hypothetical protein PHYBOEH_008004 [Phytophthora boehmeriae]|uniref:Uncharacterized protein n=1 Tax=Phytophthora boehmeriae TaxID=109152 RepID=A0A8T1W4B7_9STRA|nr:hypothetical protein PHYBOEH_008004 [Phytophthora boehmeriae]